MTKIPPVDTPTGEVLHGHTPGAVDAGKNVRSMPFAEADTLLDGISVEKKVFSPARTKGSGWTDSRTSGLPPLRTRTSVHFFSKIPSNGHHFVKLDWRRFSPTKAVKR